MHVKPIGVLQMEDQGERDDKIIAVHLHDPAFRGFNDISELPAHRLMEVRSFFQDYKKNENKVRHARAPKGNLLLESWRSCRRSLPSSRALHEDTLCESNNVLKSWRQGCAGSNCI